jgi:hypothetical protein
MSQHLQSSLEGDLDQNKLLSFPSNSLSISGSYDPNLDLSNGDSNDVYSMVMPIDRSSLMNSTSVLGTDLPFLHPSDPSSYSALPASYNTDSNGFPFVVDGTSGVDSRFGSFDWSGGGGLLSHADLSESSSNDMNQMPSFTSQQTELGPEALVPLSIEVSDSSNEPSPFATSTVPEPTHPSTNPAPCLPSHTHSKAKCHSKGSSSSSSLNRERNPVQSLPEGSMTVSMEHQLINRLQWYQVNCKFMDPNGKPLLPSREVSISPNVAFVDGRRRLDVPGNDQSDTGITVSVIATCASTGQTLEKCKKCREKDKALRKRKRKRDTEILWSDQDEEANTKLVQLFSTGTEQINDDGILSLRFRIGCCVGVSKQHHLNHIRNHPETGKEHLEIHKSCDGVILTLIVKIQSKILNTTAALSSVNVFQLNASILSPVRVLGKVTDAERQKLMQKEEHVSDDHLSSEDHGGTTSSDDFTISTIAEIPAQNNTGVDRYMATLPTRAETEEDGAATATATVEEDDDDDDDDDEPHHHHPHHSHHNNHNHHQSPQLKQTALPHVFGDLSIQSIQTMPVKPFTPSSEEELIDDGLPTKKQIITTQKQSELTHYLPTDAAHVSEFSSQVPGRAWHASGGVADIEEISMEWRSRRQFKGCSSCAARGDRELFTAISPSKITPLFVLNHFASTYQSTFERIIPATTLKNMNSVQATNLFAEPSFDPLSGPTPAKLQVYSVLAVCSCITGYLDSAHKFWSWAIEMANNLLALPLNSDPKDTALFADGLNRLAYYFGSGGDAEKGAFYNQQAVKCLQSLAAAGHADLVYALPVYETALWSYVTYHLDNRTLQQAQAWAIGQKKYDMLTYTYFLQILHICIPDLNDYVAIVTRLNQVNPEDEGLIVTSQVPRVPLSALHPFNISNLVSSPFAPIPAMTADPNGQFATMRSEALTIVSSLRALYAQPDYLGASTKKHAAAAIIDNGFYAMDAWFNGDRTNATEYAKTTLIQSSLLEFPQFSALIHIYFSCFICLFVAEETMTRQQQDPTLQYESPWADYVELGIRSFTRVSHYRWIRVLLDYFVHRLDSCLGRHLEFHTCPLRDGAFDQGFEP